MINKQVLEDIDNLKHYFKNAKPFPYVVIDNFFDNLFYKEILDNFLNYYGNNRLSGKLYNTEVEKNKWTSQGNLLSDKLVSLGNYFQSNELKNFLKSITGFQSLNTTTFNTENVGFYHLMEQNSYLGPHIDHMMDMDSNELGYHVLNIIVYITREWNPNWGGHTFFTDKKHLEFTDVEFKPNRAVVFMHSPISIHGTNRVNCPADHKRISIYFDYYSNEINPYNHLGYKFLLHRSPHLFFLPTFKDYFLRKNRKYLFHFLSHYKNKILVKITK